MPQEEITGGRPGNYSSWHRRVLPKDCYMTDGDWFEQRLKDGKLTAVAYIETIQVPSVDRAVKGEFPVWSSKKSLCSEIEEKMAIPSYVVWHNAECNDFLIARITELTNPKRMNEERYVIFLKGMGLKRKLTSFM